MGSFPFLLVGLFQLITIAWIYGGYNKFYNKLLEYTILKDFFKGSNRFVKDLESMLGPKPKWFRYLIIAFWNIICPIGTFVIN